MLTICHRQNELHSIFSSKVRDCYRYDNNDLYMKLIPQNCTFQIRAPQVIWVSTSKVMTSSVKNEHVLELVSRVVASARKRGLADDGILSIWGAFINLPALNPPFRDNRGGLSRKGVAIPIPFPFPSRSRNASIRDKPAQWARERRKPLKIVNAL